MLPPLSKESRECSSRNELALLTLKSLMWLQAQSLPGWSPGLLALEQRLGLFLVGIAQSLIRLFAGIRPRVLFVLLLDLPLLGILP